MAITAVTASATTGGSTGSTGFTLTSPSGTTAGDVLVCVVAEKTAGPDAVINVADTATGTRTFTKINFGAQNGSASTSIWYRVVQSGDPTGAGGWKVTVTTSGEACLMAYRGVDNTTPIDATGTADSSLANATFDSVTTLTNGAWFVGGLAANIATAPLGSFAGGSSFPVIRANAGNGGNISTREGAALIDVPVATAGPTGAFAYTISVSSWGTFTFSLRPGGPQSYSQSLSASLTPAGTLQRAMTRLLSAAVSASGSVARSILKSLAATIAAAASLATTSGTSYAQAFAASLTATGTIRRATVKGISATVSGSGFLGRSTVRALSASLSGSGVLNRGTARAISASLTGSGTVKRATTKALSASVTGSGTVRKGVSRAFAASLSGLVGALSALGSGGSQAFSLAFSATLTASGTITRATGHSLSGVISLQGAVLRSLARTLSGVLVGNGILSRSIARTLVGSVAGIGGGVGKSLTRQFAATLAPSSLFTPLKPLLGLTRALFFKSRRGMTTASQQPPEPGWATFWPSALPGAGYRFLSQGISRRLFKSTRALDGALHQASDPGWASFWPSASSDNGFLFLSNGAVIVTEQRFKSNRGLADTGYRFRSSGGFSLAAIPIVPSIQPTIRTGDVSIPFLLDFSPDLSSTDQITSAAVTVLAQSIISPTTTPQDVTATLLQGTPSVTGTVATALIGNANAVVNTVYTLKYVVTLATGERIQESITGILCPE